MYNAKAAERHWERLFNLFERTLKLSAWRDQSIRYWLIHIKSI
jgi:hypothetical protein